MRLPIPLLAPVVLLALAAAPFAVAPAFAQAARPATAKGPAWGSGPAIRITVTNDGFTPATVTLRHDRHYTLHFHNASNRGHNFSAKKFFRIARVAPGDARAVKDDEVNLAAGQRVAVRIVAPDTPNAVYDFRSTVLGDAARGMKGEIRVR